MLKQAAGIGIPGFDEKAPHQLAPLNIMMKSLEAGELCSYKAPWKRPAARAALATAGRYEAGGNIMWCDPTPRGEQERLVAGDPVSWKMVEDVAAQHFSVSTEKGRWQRVVFPVVLLVGVEHKALLLPDTVPWFMELPLVGSHVFVAAWYLAMARALSAGAPGASRGNMLKVAALLECGLTVTYHAKECATVAHVAPLSISQSEVDTEPDTEK